MFELRTYTSPEGRLNDLVARFRNDTLRIFEKHGMDNVGYWVPTDAPASANTLVYILAHDSRDAATKSWAAFRADPGMEGRHGSYAGERADRHESRLGIPRGHGFLAAEVTLARRRGGWGDALLRVSTSGESSLCVAALGGLSIYWLAQAQNAATDADRFTGVTRRLEAEGWRVSRRSFEAVGALGLAPAPGGQLMFVEAGARVSRTAAAGCAS